MLFDAEGNRMTPSYAVKQGTRYRYYVSRPLITQDQRESATALRIPAAEIEHLVTSRVRQWLLDPGGIYQSTRLPDPSAQRRLIARAVEIGKSWTELPGTRQRALLTTLVDRIDVGVGQIDIHLHPTRLAALLDDAATPLPSSTTTKPRSCPCRYGCGVLGGRSRCGSIAPTRLPQQNLMLDWSSC
jgi:site-specific DNA recombinase